MPSVVVRERALLGMGGKVEQVGRTEGFVAL